MTISITPHDGIYWHIMLIIIHRVKLLAIINNKSISFQCILILIIKFKHFRRLLADNKILGEVQFVDFLHSCVSVAGSIVKKYT